MELLFVAVGGLLIGTLLRYLLPGRTSHGAALLPGVGLVAASAIWAVLTWAGWRFDGGWIWWVSLGGAIVAVVATGIVLPRRRRDADARSLAALSRA